MRTSIGISWTYTEFHVVTTRNGKVESTWSSPQPVTSLRDFSDALFNACNALSLKQGGHVSIAYESDVHTHEFFELPKMAKKDLHKYLQRRIILEKPFKEDASWCYHEAHHGKNTEGVLLHLMPKDIVDAMIRICDDFFFVAKRLVPLTEIFTSHIASLKLDRNEKLLLIALFENRVQMVVARGNGEILFVRELGYAWSENNGERLITDADRTLRYAKQRTGGSISRIIMMGDQSESAMNVLNKTVTLPIVIDESSADCFFWAKKVSDLPISNANNFIPKLARRALTRRTALRSAVMSLAFLLMLTVSFTAWVEYKVYNSNEPEIQIEADVKKLQRQIEHIEQQMLLAERDRSQLSKFTVSGLNLPVIFFNHLGNLTPADMILSSAEIHREKKGWHFRLTGKSSLQFTRIPESLTRLESGFAAKPWNASIEQSWRSTWLAQLQAGAASNDSVTGFEMSGVLR